MSDWTLVVVHSIAKGNLSSVSEMHVRTVRSGRSAKGNTNRWNQWNLFVLYLFKRERSSKETRMIILSDMTMTRSRTKRPVKRHSVRDRHMLTK